MRYKYTYIIQSLNGTIHINGHYYEVDYTPNVSSNYYNNPNQNKTSVTYITNISDHQSYTTSMETTVHEDWICEYVFYTI